METSTRENAISSPLGFDGHAMCRSPNELDAASDARTDMDDALDIAAEVVDEQLSRQHLRPIPRTELVASRDQARLVSLSQRPGRLEDAVANMAHPCSQNRGALESTSYQASDLVIFKHMEALEEAVQNGEALAGRLPELPTNPGGACDRPAQLPSSHRGPLKSTSDRSHQDAIPDVAALVVHEDNPKRSDLPKLGSSRPGRLEDSSPDVENPCNKHLPVDFSELVVFKHLKALEEAVQSGESLEGCFPDLPANLRSPTSQYRPAPTCRGRLALRAVGGGLLAKAPIGVAKSAPRYFFGEDCYGMQPPLKPGSRKHATNQMAFGHSALRGTPLQRYHHVSHASALWVNTEASRLKSEMSKPYGASPAIAFLQNDGPQALVPLQPALCN